MLITQAVTNMPYKSPHPRHREKKSDTQLGLHTHAHKLTLWDYIHYHIAVSRRQVTFCSQGRVDVAPWWVGGPRQGNDRVRTMYVKLCVIKFETDSAVMEESSRVKGEWEELRVQDFTDLWDVSKLPADFISLRVFVSQQSSHNADTLKFICCACTTHCFIFCFSAFDEQK